MALLALLNFSQLSHGVLWQDFLNLLNDTLQFVFGDRVSPLLCSRRDGDRLVAPALVLSVIAHVRDGHLVGLGAGAQGVLGDWCSKVLPSAFGVSSWLTSDSARHARELAILELARGQERLIFRLVQVFRSWVHGILKALWHVAVEAF